VPIRADGGRAARPHARWGIGAALCTLALVAVAASAPGATPVQVGESIYLRGVLGSGAPLEGDRQGGEVRAKGAEAACVNCHQHSGLGANEGRALIPPIAGRYLFQPRAKGTDHSNLPYIEGMRANREPYTEATLARAIRDGIDAEGKTLGYLMPRFALNDADLAALIAYLKTLDAHQAPGVTDSVLHFATIITPDADPVKRKGMLNVLQQYFTDRNTRQMIPSPTLQAPGKSMYSKAMYMVNRRWQLHVWELTGPAATWQTQLQRHLAVEPVFAVISGLAGENWAPVHEFCEKSALPCLFPNVEVPVDATGDFYSLYFSKGVLLEAELIAAKIVGTSGGPPVKEVHQLYRAGDSGEPAATALAAALKRRGIAVHNHVLAAKMQGKGPVDALRGVANVEALVLWLRAPDVAALGSSPPLEPATVYMSGLMGGLEGSPLPSSWRGRTQLAYPFDLPERRRVRVDYPLGWFMVRHIPIVAEQVQVDTYLACALLGEALSHMSDAFVRPYLIERLQRMLDHLIMTGYYPHLALATNQHFASKGGYLVHFAQASGTRLVADSDWLTP
jgi:mono/diheme cytochrome c family protein